MAPSLVYHGLITALLSLALIYNSCDDSAHPQYHLAKVIEQIYNCRYTKLVLPLSFHENVITYKLSNNLLLSALHFSSKLLGSDMYLIKWLNKLAENEIEFLKVIAPFVFDNVQVIGKWYRVKMNQTNVLTNVINRSVYLSVNKDNKIEIAEKSQLKNWIFDLLDQRVTGTVLDSFWLI